MHKVETLILAISCDETMQTSLPRAVVLILDIIPTIYFSTIDVVVVVIVKCCCNLSIIVLLLDLLLLSILLLMLYLLADNSILKNPSELRVELIKFRVIILSIFQCIPVKFQISHRRGMKCMLLIVTCRLDCPICATSLPLILEKLLLFMDLTIGVLFPNRL